MNMFPYISDPGLLEELERLGFKIGQFRKGLLPKGDPDYSRVVSAEEARKAAYHTWDANRQSEKPAKVSLPAKLPSEPVRKKASKPEAVATATFAERKQRIGRVRQAVKRLTPHPDCPVCSARREKTKEAMRKRRSG